MTKKTTLSNRILSFIERVGNALPSPAFLFGMLAVLVLIVSCVGYFLDWNAIHPATNETVEVNNLLSVEGLHQIILNLVENFTGFAPLGIVIVAMLGVGIAEGSGLIRSAIVALLSKVNRSAVTFMLVLAGVLSNIASDIGYILVIPVAGVIFHSLGRNPVAGMAAAFAGVSGGFSANIAISTTDVLLSGISTSAVEILDPTYSVGTLANYYFMAASTLIIAFVGTFITNRFVEPRLGKYTGNVEPTPIEPLTRAEKRGLKLSLLTLLGWIVIILVGILPENGILRDSNDPSIFRSIVFEGFVTFLFFICASMGIVYGFVAGKFKKANDVLSSMNDSVKSLVSYIVLVFFAAQFIAWFNSSNLGMLLAIKGVEGIQALDLGLIPLVILVILFSALINLMMGSASAKWLLLAPIIIPMFMMLGYSPEMAQCAYRIGDSSTNIISPLMSFFPLIIVYFQKYNKESGIGTIISTMLPYSIAFLLAWTVFVIAWLYFDIPLGPGASVYYTPTL